MRTKTNLNNKPALLKGDEFMQKNMPKEAIGEYLKSIMLKSNDLKSHLGASKAYKKLQQYEKAIKHLEKAKKISYFDYEVYYELGLNHLLNTEFEKANKNFRNTIKLNPDFLNAQIQLAISHELMDEPQMAIAVYEKIIEQNPEYLSAYNHKAGLLMNLGDFEEAAKIFFKILSLDENYSKAYLGLAICFDKLQKYSFAVRFYKKFITANPKNETVKSIAARVIDIVNTIEPRQNSHLKIVK